MPAHRIIFSVFHSKCLLNSPCFRSIEIDSAILFGKVKGVEVQTSKNVDEKTDS